MSRVTAQETPTVSSNPKNARQVSVSWPGTLDIGADYESHRPGNAHCQLQSEKCQASVPHAVNGISCECTRQDTRGGEQESENGYALPGTFTTNPVHSVWYTCLAFFGLELTVGVSWAVPLDIGADYAGSVSAVMNSCGNIGGAISPAILAYLVKYYGWNVPFVIASGFCVIAAVLFTRIDATRPIFAE